MAIVVPHDMPELAESAGQIGVVASSSTLSLPLLDGTNHLLGHRQMALLHAQGYSSGRSGTGRVYTYRHPNTDTLIARFYVENITPLTAGITIDFTAGSGATVQVDVGSEGYYWAAFDWNPADSGNQEITYQIDPYCDLRNISIWCVYRPTMDQAADLAIDRCNDTFALAGSDENKYLIRDDINNDIAGLAARILDARRYGLRQAVSWTGIGSFATGSGAAWTDLWGGKFFRHRSRLLRSGDTTRDYRVFMRTFFSGGGADTYAWRVFGTVGSAGRFLLNQNVPTWDQSADYLEIDCTAIDDLKIQVKYTAAAGSPTIYCCEVSIFERIV